MLLLSVLLIYGNLGFFKSCADPTSYSVILEKTCWSNKTYNWWDHEYLGYQKFLAPEQK